MLYLDTSAFLKAPLREPEARALRAAVTGRRLVSSVLLEVEAARASRLRGRGAERRTSAGLASVSLLPIDEQIVRSARDVEPLLLRSLDAIHLATALSLDDLEGFFCYDVRLADAARAAGLSVLAPT